MTCSRPANTILASLILTFGPGPGGHASTDAGSLCESAAAKAAETHGVPYDVLLAVSVIESGRESRPWPWTVNIGGDGYWFDTTTEAEATVQSALDAGMTNIDLGCFQLNYRWHAEAFSSIPDMLDPLRNANYAAAYLAAKYQESGDWSAAAAAYHSSTPEHAERYRARFDETRAVVAGDTELADDQATKTHLNGFPLLIAGQAGVRGSLVPVTVGGVRLIGAP